MAAIDLKCSFFRAQPCCPRLHPEAVGQSNGRVLRRGSFHDVVD